MSKVNTGRVVLAGLAAGLVMNVVDYVVNVPVLGQQWNEATKALGVSVEKVSATAAIGWITMDFLGGIFIAWLYAAIRPRYGAGAATGLRAGAATWFIVHLALSALVFQGLYPQSLYVASTAGALVAALAGGWVAGWLYREAD
jgi:hypothetical protein